MLEFFSNKVAGLLECNFIKKRLQHKCFSVKFAKSWRASFFTEHFRWLLLEISYELSLYCIWEWWIVSLRGMHWFSSAYFFLLLAFCFFPFFLLFLFFVDFTTCLGNEVNLSILEIKLWSCSYIPKWRFEGWVGSALLSIIYVVGLVQFWEKLSYILPPLASLELLAAEYLREANTSNFIYYHLLMAICSLDALKKSSKKKEMRIKKGKIYTVERKQKSKKPGW